MTDIKAYEIGDFFFSFMPEGSPFKGTLSFQYPELDGHIDSINFGSVNARKRYAKVAHKTIGIDADLLTDALAEVASLRREEVTAAAEEGDDTPSMSIEFLMFKMEDMELFHTSDDTCYVSYRNGDHIETWPIASYHFEQYLRGIYFAEFAYSIDSTELKRAIETFKAKALFDGVERKVFWRVARYHGALYIDIGDPDWKVIRVGRCDWEVVSESPVKFVRNRTTLPLPMPDEGGSLGDLKPFLNVGEDDFKLVVGWILGALNPDGPYPLVELTGRQGVAKSTAARVLTRLVDPKYAPLRFMPTNERDLAIMASHAHSLAFDNISLLRHEMSDALCRVSTGGGLATRRLYTDDEEAIFDVKRPLILNGINSIVVRGDLQERTILVVLLPISGHQRRSEKEFWEDFEEAHPRIFGAILDVLVGIVDCYDSVKLDSTPRMADFTRWVTAAEKALGWEDGEFAALYAERQESASVDAMSNDLVVEHISILLEGSETGVWSGTATELLGRLNGLASDSDQRLKEWPKGANTLSKHLRRVAPQLEAIGIEYEEHHEGQAKRKIKTLRLLEKEFDDSNG